MIKKILIILLIGINCHNFGMQLKQPKTLFCQALKAVVKNALEKGNVKEFNELPNELMIPASYLYQAKNNPTVALFNNYIDLLKNNKLPDATDVLSVCGADVDLVYKLFFYINTYIEKGLDYQTAFNYLIHDKDRDFAFKGVELILLSKMRKMVDLNAMGQAEFRAPPLFIAIDKGDVNLVRLLINAGANVNFIESDGNSTPLIYAVTLASFKRSNNRGETVILNKFKEIIELLLEAGTDINAIMSDGETALEDARFDPQLTEFLEKNGAQ